MALMSLPLACSMQDLAGRRDDLDVRTRARMYTVSRQTVLSTPQRQALSILLM